MFRQSRKQERSLNEMNKMPGFTANSSFYNTGRRYGRAAIHGIRHVSRAVYPERATGPYGPIGLPGQDCEGGCLHTCMLGGGRRSDLFFERCMQICRNTCSNPSLFARL